ncbi:TPA: hypothetical protein QCH88_004364 [Enterobacter asburiae]|nr:hypothetical protein [Enterobacter asburiae]
MDNTLFDFGVAYDPTKITIMFGDEKITGLDCDIRASCSRRLNGVASAKIYIQAHSPWVLKLKKLLGEKDKLHIEYSGSGPFYDSCNFVADMVVKGYDVNYTGDIPVFVFSLDTEERL